MFYRYSFQYAHGFTFVSNGCRVLTGYTEHDFLFDKKINYSNIIYQADKIHLSERYRAEKGKKFELNEEYRIVCRDGNMKWVREIAKGVYNEKGELKYIEGYIEDIETDRNESHALNSLTAYQKAVDTAAIVSIADIKGRIIYANDLFCEISKFTRDELIGKNHRIINSGTHSKEFFKDLWDTISAGKIWNGEIQNKAKDGSYYWVDTTVSPIFNNKNKVVQYLSIRRLITERKQLEQEKEKLNSDLTHRYNELMQFNYIVSHNLRAPVANMIGLARMLSEDGEIQEGNAKALVDYISKSVLTLDVVIKDLSQILSARSPIHEKIEEVVLPDIIKSVEDNLENQIVGSGTRFVIDINKNAAVFKSIKSYIQSIFYNLISNAIKYRNDATNPIIVIKAKKINKHLLITFTDNGIGMDLDKVGGHLFGLYKKFNFDKEGRGLGLHMTKTQVESLGGTINVFSREGLGTTFVIKFPV